MSNNIIDDTHTAVNGVQWREIGHDGYGHSRESLDLENGYSIDCRGGDEFYLIDDFSGESILLGDVFSKEDVDREIDDILGYCDGTPLYLFSIQ